MVLWVDKACALSCLPHLYADPCAPAERANLPLQHRPKALDALIIHRDIGANLQKLVSVRCKGKKL